MSTPTDRASTPYRIRVRATPDGYDPDGTVYIGGVEFPFNVHEWDEGHWDIFDVALEDALEFFEDAPVLYGSRAHVLEMVRRFSDEVAFFDDNRVIADRSSERTSSDDRGALSDTEASSSNDEAQRVWAGLGVGPMPVAMVRKTVSRNSDSPVMVLPNLWTTDESLQRILLCTAMRAEDAGLEGDWSRVPHIQGVMANPASRTPPDTADFRLEVWASKGAGPEQLAYAQRRVDGAEDAFLPEWRERSREAIRAFLLEVRDPGAVRVKKHTSVGAPWHTSSFEIKGHILRYLTELHPAVKSAITHPTESNLKEAFRSVGFLRCAVAVLRFQLDPTTPVDGLTLQEALAHLLDGDASYDDHPLPSKSRVVRDWRGDVLVADKTPPDMYRTQFCFWSARTRSARSEAAGSDTAHAPAAQMLGKGQKSVPLFATPPVREIIDTLTVAAKLGAYVVLDGPNNDSCSAPEPRRYMLEEAERAGLLSEAGARSMLLQNAAPTLMTNDWRGGKGGRFTANPFDVDRYHYGGAISSGTRDTTVKNNIVTSIAVTWAVFERFRVADTPYGSDLVARCVRDGEGNVWRKFCRDFAWHRTPVKSWVAGDNVAVWTDDPEYARVCSAELALLCPFFFFEMADSFLGQRYDSSTGQFGPDLSSLLYNYLAPDRDYGSKYAPARAHGWRERIRQYYYLHPRAGELVSIVDEEFTRELGTSLTDWTDRLAADSPLANLHARYNLATAEFLMNPDSIHYKVDETEVDSSILDEYFFSWLPDDQRKVRDLTLGSLVLKEFK